MILHEHFAGRQFYGMVTPDGASLLGLPYFDSKGDMIGYLIYKRDDIITTADLKIYGMAATSSRGTSGMVHDLLPMPYSPIEAERVTGLMTSILLANGGMIKDIMIKLPAT